MPRRQWRVKGRRQPLSDAVRFHLETGGYPERGQFATWADAWFITSRVYEALWREYGEEITAAWVAEHPGTRPWAWWKFEALEARECLEGAAYVYRGQAPNDGAWIWKEGFGLPGRPQARKPGAEPAEMGFESEAAYLRRLALLLPGEAEQLAEEDFEADVVSIPELPPPGELCAQRPLTAPALASANGAVRRLS